MGFTEEHGLAQRGYVQHPATRGIVPAVEVVTAGAKETPPTSSPNRAYVGNTVQKAKKWNAAKRPLTKPQNRTLLFLRIVPPMAPPLNSSFVLGMSLNFGVPSAFFVCRNVLLIALSQELFSVPNTEPCQAFVPDLVMTLTTEPALRPYSGPKLLVIITYCWTKLVSLTISPGPQTLFSLLFCP